MASLPHPITVSMSIAPAKFGNKIITCLDTSAAIKAFYLAPIDGPLSSAVEYYIPPGVTVEGAVDEIRYGHHVITVNLEPGKYNIIPFCVTRHDQLPDAIFDAIGYVPGNDDEARNLDFLRLPIRIEGQYLIVE